MDDRIGLAGDPAIRTGYPAVALDWATAHACWWPARCRPERWGEGKGAGHVATAPEGTSYRAGPGSATSPARSAVAPRPPTLPQPRSRSRLEAWEASNAK